MCLGWERCLQFNDQFLFGLITASAFGVVAFAFRLFHDHRPVLRHSLKKFLQYFGSHFSFHDSCESFVWIFNEQVH
jgi:hypothetical protein